MTLPPEIALSVPGRDEHANVSDDVLYRSGEFNVVCLGGQRGKNTPDIKSAVNPCEVPKCDDGYTLDIQVRVIHEPEAPTLYPLPV